MNERTGILLLGHGSTRPHNKELVEKVAEMIADQKNVLVKIAFLNMDKPDLKGGLESFKGTDVERIVALPLFLAHGVHTLEDIPEELNLGNGRKTVVNIDGRSVEVLYAEPLGADPRIAEIAYDKAEEALAR
ncbi:MAG TPA: sirohydrochlorin nickelochelatase [Methanosarcinales archaeon]|nr:sirohydrochlorin nickelochelatase [Methanosarcinales archaeon]